jgi:hypothetical protein
MCSPFHVSGFLSNSRPIYHKLLLCVQPQFPVQQIIIKRPDGAGAASYGLRGQAEVLAGVAGVQAQAAPEQERKLRKRQFFAAVSPERPAAAAPLMPSAPFSYIFPSYISQSLHKQAPRCKY